MSLKKIIKIFQFFENYCALKGLIGGQNNLISSQITFENNTNQDILEIDSTLYIILDPSETVHMTFFRFKTIGEIQRSCAEKEDW